ncbi:MAG: hypothetical protein ABIS86_11645 [Streptosporangiaceae bacterium]
MSEWFSREIVDTGRLRLFCFLVCFIAGFLFIRFSVRMIRAQVRWWPGNITPGGRHIHHAVFGVVFMCVGGVIGLVVPDDNNWSGVAAGVLGVGTALVLDEFALILHLEDVYWKEQGRLSVQVVFIAVALCGLMLLGLNPLGLDDLGGDDGTPVPVWLVAVTLLLNLSISLIALLKGKVWLGIVGIFIGIFSIVGAIRLARSDSPWARRSYQPDSRKMRRTLKREARWGRPTDRLMHFLENLIGGRPSL